ncbi:MAG TPA: fibronectin type III domain-containing protein [Thermoanaerobaculia bacterium]|nr:fibronectin type III domain-containing protein [Thermoanaerobaculia bacterium]
MWQSPRWGARRTRVVAGSRWAVLARCLTLALALAAAIAACGKKGDPMPPPRLIPAQTGDLRVQQTGSELVLTMSYPAMTTSGLPLESLQAIEIVALRPPPGASAFQSPDPRAFEAMAAVAKRLAGAELVAATQGSELVITLDARPGATFGPADAATPATTPLRTAPAEPAAEVTDAAPEMPASPPPAADAAAAATSAPGPPEAPGPPPILLAVRAFGPRGHPGPLSNVVSIAPRMPPPPPQTLTAAPTAEGVRLEWTTISPGAAGFDLLRRRAGERSFGDPIARLDPGALTHLDDDAAFGVHYEYTVRTVAARDPLIESVDGPVRGVEYLDVFPPPTPSNLVALAEQGRVRLLWDRVEAPDLAGYRVYREEDGSPPRELPRDPGTGTGHTDDRVRPGATYVYRVTAVDLDDNESAPSEPATATPR